MRICNMRKRSLVQSQIGAAAVTNIDNLIDSSKVTNSAEVEQESKQENDCGISICVNFIGVQEQTAVADVTNVINTIIDSDVTNSAEVEQETEQESVCETSICANVIGAELRQLLLL